MSNTISGLVSQQLPAYLRDSAPNFQLLLQYYYKFMEDSTANGTVYQLRNILNNTNVDTTQDQFLQYFQNDFLPYFPQATALDTRKLLKAATKFYQTKGSQDSVEFLFRVLYNLSADVSLPKNNILRLSDGKWTLPQSIKLSLSSQNQTFNVSLLEGRLGTGSESNTICVIESVTVAVDPTLNREIVEMFLSQVSDVFTPGESIIIPYGTGIFEEKIIGSISGIVVDPNNQGLKYVGTKYNPDGSISYPGDPVSIIGGLANSNDIIQAVAFVGNVSQGSLVGVTVVKGGYGYQLDPNTIVTVVDVPGDTGLGANVIVNGVDVANQVELMLNTDSIAFKANLVIGNTTYQFANNINANANTLLANALSFLNINVAPLTSLEVVYGGSGYTEIPSLNLLSVYDTDLSSNLYAVYLANPTPNNYAAYINAKGHVEDFGLMAAVVILAGGSGYSNTTDKIVVDSAVGYGAAFNFITDANGAITQTMVTNTGFGYAIPKPSVFVANSANTANVSAGSGASLIAYGYNDGQDLTLSVSDIGRVESVRITNYGFDYVTTPLVSLRNEDVKVQSIPTNKFFVQGEELFQGANVNAASYIAYVDQYDRTNNILRLYNYIGTLNVSTNLLGANFNTTPISITIYGNGKARANAQFFGGLIKYPGFWLTTDGFLSADQYLQDSNTYHNYSYVVKVEKPLAAYHDTIMSIVHPAGMKMLGICTITDQRSTAAGLYDEDIFASNTANSVGSLVYFDSNNILHGNGTQFIQATMGPGAENAYITITSTGSGRQITLQIKSVQNANALTTESNGMYFAPDQLSTTTGGNTLVTTATFANVVANDIILTNIAGNAQTSLVKLVAATTINVNTIFATNTVNNFYMVIPTTNSSTYLISTEYVTVSV
ncbi:MAG: hypothetical protein ACREQ5_05325 [Candidatus Dormibacteria bacterium]